MGTHQTTLLVAVLLSASVAGCSQTEGESAADRDQPERVAPAAPPRLPVSVVARNLDNPRGLAFGPDGALYVVEAGLGGKRRTSASTCRQVPYPVGPYSGGTSGRVSRISQSRRTVVARGLPSTQTSHVFGDIVYGGSAIAFIGRRPFVLVGGGGCSHGNPAHPNGVYEILPRGQLRLIADLSKWVRAHPVARPHLKDFEPDGAWAGMTSHAGALYAVEAQGGQLVRITPRGQVTRVVDLSPLGYLRPTSVTWHKGAFYVGTFGPYPVKPRAMSIYRITPSGDYSVHAKGFSTVLSIAFRCDSLYVLEAPPNLDLLRVDPDGKVTKVLDARTLKISAGVAVGPDGALYLSDKSFFYRPPQGRIIRVALPPC